MTNATVAGDSVNVSLSLARSQQVPCILEVSTEHLAIRIGISIVLLGRNLPWLTVPPTTFRRLRLRVAKAMKEIVTLGMPVTFRTLWP